MNEINQARKTLQEYSSPDKWVTKFNNQYKPRQIWFPLSENISFWDEEFHDLMLRDHLRMGKFQEAVKHSVRYLLNNKSKDETLRVLDIGTGYGILSYWVVKFAKEYQPDVRLKVYAIEGNPITAGEAYRRLDNEGFMWKQTCSSGSILVLNTSSYYLSSALCDNKLLLKQFDPELWNNFDKTKSFKTFDFIISETLGSIVDNEDIACILDHAVHEFLNANGLVVPHRLKSFLVPIHSEASAEYDDKQCDEYRLHQAVACHKYERIGDQYELPSDGDPFDMIYDAIIPKEDYLSKPQQVSEWEFPALDFNHLRRHYTKELSYEINKSGSLSGFKGFFVAELVKPEVGEVTLSIEGHNIKKHETSDCWKHLYLPIRKQIRVNEKDAVNLTFKREVDKLIDQKRFTYHWGGNVITRDKKYEFSQKHEMLTPFLPPRKPFISYVVKNSVFSLEAAHQGTVILPDSDKEFLDIIEDSIKNEPLSLRGLFESGTSHSKLELNKYNKARISEEILSKCYVAFPSVRKDGTIKYASSLPLTEEEIKEKAVDCFCLVYKVTQEPNPISQFISIRDVTHFEEKFLVEENAGEDFAIALIIPEYEYRTLYKEDIADLHTVMYFLQARIFLRILTIKTQERLLATQSSTFAHELKHLAIAFSDKWLSNPSTYVKEAIASVGNEPLSNLDWKVVPYPKLIEDVACVLKLWSGGEIEDILPRAHTNSIGNWVRDCWGVVLKITRVNVCKGFNLSNDRAIKDAQIRFNRIEEILSAEKVLRIKTAGDLEKAKPSLVLGCSSNTSDTWLVLTKFMINAMYNFVRHGDVKSGLQLHFNLIGKNANRTFEILITNRIADRSYLPGWFPSARTDYSNTMRGRKVQEELAYRLDAIRFYSDHPFTISLNGVKNTSLNEHQVKLVLLPQPLGLILGTHVSGNP